MNLFFVQVVLISGETGSGKTTQVCELIKNLHLAHLIQPAKADLFLVIASLRLEKKEKKRRRLHLQFHLQASLTVDKLNSTSLT